MQTYFSRLASLLESRSLLCQEQLERMLFLMRAPKSCKAVTFVCQRLLVLRDENESFAELEEQEPFGDGFWPAVEAVAKLAGLDPHFDRDVLLSGELPLRPETSHSGLFDVLVLDMFEQSKQYREVAAWFAWQVLWFQALRWDQKKYRACLVGERGILLREDTGKGRGRFQAKGSQVYGASLEIRTLARPESKQELDLWAANIQGWSGEDALALAAAMRLALKREAAKKRAQSRAIDTAGLSQLKIDRLRETDDLFPISSSQMALFLEITWGEGAARSRQDSQIRREVTARRRRKFGQYTALQNEYQGQGIHSGIATEFFPGGRRGSSLTPDDDTDDGEVEPSFTLFLAKSGDPIRGLYAARSAQHHIENQNALLPWSAWRLSLGALRWVDEAIRTERPESFERRAARLLIGLSLLTGRSFDAVSTVALTPSGCHIPRKKIVCLCLEPPTLAIRPARPALKGDHKLPRFCMPTGRLVRLPMPHRWHGLTRQVCSQKSWASKAVIRTARSILAEAPAYLGISERGVSGMMKLALLDVSRGDLGIVKVVTDAQDANLNNIIHYASYRRDHVEKLWRAAAESLGLAFSAPAYTDGRLRSVGAPQRYVLGELAAALAKVQNRFEESLRDQLWYAAFNNLTLYLYAWLSIALAGRSATQPFPLSITVNGIVLIADKQRSDESTNRLGVLSVELRQQIEVYRALASCLGIHLSALKEKTLDSAERQLSLCIVKSDGQVIPFQPKRFDDHPDLATLPGNFGRKLVRSLVKDIPGRLIDAGLGHWVRGRHPYVWTSTFDFKSFAKRWSAEQASLQGLLGLSVLQVEGLMPLREPLRMPCQRSRPAKPPPMPKPQPLSSEEIDQRIQLEDEFLVARVFGQEPRLPEAGLSLVYKVLEGLAKEGRADLPECATAVCDYIRSKTKIPLFAIRPRARFQRNWLTDSFEFQNFAYVEAAILPLFQKDLARLPAPPPCADCSQVELGRMVMICVWLAGVAEWSALDALLAYLSGSRPVLATHELRLLVLRVRCARTKEKMRRTLILPDIVATFFVVERQRIREWLKANYVGLPHKRRRSRVDQWLSAYWGFLGADQSLTLTGLMGAARQSLMTGSAPILAAYASGSIFTEDLSDSEIRRLSGLVSRREGSVEDQPKPDELNDLSGSECGLLPTEDYAARLGRIRSKYVSEWRRRLHGGLKGASPLQKLLVRYALWALETLCKRSNTRILTKRQRNDLQKRFHVIGHGLLGFAVVDEDDCHIAGHHLELLSELTSDHFHARVHHGAWKNFKTFLGDPRLDDSDRAGFSVGYLGHVGERHISAKVLSSNEVKQLLVSLQSQRSCIANPLTRIVASRHVKLAYAAGARRGEIEHLRRVDAQSDLVRIQPYSGHSLKTEASQRNLPLAFLPTEASRLVDEAIDEGRDRLIDAAPNISASGDNFFDPLNKEIKRVTGDADFGQHHLRHTFASRMTLSLLAEAVSLDAIVSDLPWLSGWLVRGATLEVLMGADATSGQGLQALAGMQGHLHPSTTLRHYVHVLCIALYSLMQKRGEQFDLLTMFENRVASRATVARRAKTVRQKAENSARNRQMRNVLEVLAADASNKAVRAEGLCGANLVHHDNTERELGEREEGGVKPKGDSLAFDFAAIEAIELALSSARHSVDGNYADVGQALKELARIPSGKRGSSGRRHPLSARGGGEIPLPPPLTPGQSVRNAESVLIWLSGIGCREPDSLDWLIDKWVHQSEAREGLIRLDSNEEIQRFTSLGESEGIVLRVEPVLISASRKPKTPRPAKFRGRILIQSYQSAGISKRNASAVRWAMTWACALVLAGR